MSTKILERGLARVVSVQPQEVRALLWSFAYFFCLLAGYYVLRPVRDEMGLASGIKNLPWLFTATFIVMLAVVPVYGAQLIVDDKRKKYGLTRFAKDPQRMYNYNASAAVEFGALLFGKELLRRVFWRALQRCRGFVGPNALQVWLAPGSFEHRRLSGGRHVRRIWSRCRTSGSGFICRIGIRFRQDIIFRLALRTS